MALARVVQQTGKQGAEVGGIADRVIMRPELIVELTGALEAKKGATKDGDEQVLPLARERWPEWMYPYFDVFARLLDSDNSLLKWSDIMIVASLTAVDVEGRFAAIFDKYPAPIEGPTTVAAANIIGGSARIVGAEQT